MTAVPQGVRSAAFRPCELRAPSHESRALDRSTQALSSLASSALAARGSWLARYGLKPALRTLPLAFALLAGCLQLESRVTLHEDGTATITERLRFTRLLLDLAGDGEKELLKLLSKDAALERMKKMGEKVRLVSHELRDAEGASKESLAVYRVDDLNDLRYVSPWLAYPDFPENNAVQWEMVPLYKGRPYDGGHAGSLSVALRHLREAKGERRLEDGEAPPNGPSPIEVQAHREIGPVFRDMLKDFQLRLTFETFSPVGSALGVRNRRADVKEMDLINFTDKDLDKWGAPFLGNEELMLDLVRWELGSADIVDHVRDYANNATLPYLTPHGSRHMWWTGSRNIHFPPSRKLFDRLFAGRKLDPSPWQASPPEKHIPARFEDVGWPRSRAKEPGDAR